MKWNIRLLTLRAAGPLFAVVAVLAQQTPAPAPVNNNVASEQTARSTAEDHRRMMELLGIKSLRPGPSGNLSAPNQANYDESKANPYPDLPEVLTLKSGKKVTTAEAWWNQRRPEIIEDFDREVLGRVPTTTPKVTWSVTETVETTVGPHAVIGKRLTGHVDNSSYPAIDVDIQMALVVPAKAVGPVPVMMMFGRGGLPDDPPPPGPAGRPATPPLPGADPPATQQLIADGWGYVYINPTSIQADNGAGLTSGIIGLVNKGQSRKPEDWGSLRAWAWGASRGLDYLETDKSVDAKHVGIEGVSRYGKAALVTMAYDTRFAVVLVGSSGEGGAKLHRRNFGEAVENLTAAGEYHWMAGNFLKYGAAEATFGSKTPGDLPVDAHELIALCAPRPTFISYGVPEKGDAKWLDQQGSYMAAVAAGPVFRLLGAKDLGTSDDYKTEKMPAVNVDMLDGQLAWRQHDGGHTDAPNWKHFIPWANRMFGRKSAGTGASAAVARPWSPADQPLARADQNSMTAHTQLLEKAKKGGIDVYFEGDSITRRWGATDYPELLANWKQNFFGWNAADFGWGADRVENILWRLENGELDGVNPKVIVLLAGTNNVSSPPPPGGIEEKVADITRGLRKLVRVMQAKAPKAIIILTAIFPRNDDMAYMPVIDRINANLAQMDDGKSIRFLNVNNRLSDANGKLFDGMMDARDKLHPIGPGYQVWADGLKPLLAQVLGPPKAEDHAPPPTGDPSARPPGSAGQEQTTAERRPQTDRWKLALETDPAGLKVHREANETLPPPAPGENRVVFLGDSITAGWGRSFTTLFPGKPYIGRGIGSQTTQQMLIRFRPDVIALKPKVVVLLAGTNDIAGNTGRSTQRMIEDNIMSMIDLAEINKIRVVLVSVLPAGDYWWQPGMEPAEKIVSLNAWLKSYAAERGLVYVDCHTPMSDEKHAMKKEYSPDGVHPNLAGYAVMGPLVEAGIAQALRK